MSLSECKLDKCILFCIYLQMLKSCETKCRSTGAESLLHLCDPLTETMEQKASICFNHVKGQSQLTILLVISVQQIIIFGQILIHIYIVSEIWHTIECPLVL